MFAVRHALLFGENRSVSRKSGSFSGKLTGVIGYLLLVSLLLPSVSLGEILTETGSLRGFIAGDAPSAGYDNWLSHVSEGIDNPGYNDYGPEWLDPQHNGFGDYRVVPNTPAGDRLLDHWRRIFDSFLLYHEYNVDVLLQDSAETFRYDLVHFTDTDHDREVLILREQLDSTFFDVNGQGSADDVTGSFQNGWGLYIVDPDAPRPWLMIQMVHPCDDFIGVQGAIDLFFRLGAGAICINGAGREVVLREGAGSTNARSLSDPSRNGRAPLQVFQEAFVERYKDDYPYSALVVQVHSYDRSNDLENPVIISEGADWPYPNLPFRDREGGTSTIIQMSPNPPIPAGTYAGLAPLNIDPYYGANHVGGFNVVMPNNDIFTIDRPPSHRGDPNNVQGIHIHGVPTYVDSQAVAPFLHIELDEWPQYLEDGGYEPLELVEDPTGVPTWEDFIPWLEFYDPFFDGLEEWFGWFDDPPTSLPTSQPTISDYILTANGGINLEISDPEMDFYRCWVEVLADTDAIDEESPVVLDGVDNRDLKRVYLNRTVVAQSPWQGRTVHFAVRSVELDGSVGPHSNEISVIPNDLEGVVPVHETFETYPIAAWPPWISCFILDETDLAELVVIWRINDSAPDTLTLNLVNPYNHAYGSPLPIPVEDVTAGDVLYYQILSRDISEDGNPIYLPSQLSWYQAALVDEPTLVRSWDFESEPTDMEISGDWEWGQPETAPPDTAHSGSNVIGTNLDGGYQGQTFSTVTLSGVGLMEYGPLILSFQQSVDYPTAEEPGVAVQGGMVWWVGEAVQGPVLLPVYNYRIPPPEGSDIGYSVFSGTTDGWEEVIMDLTKYYGRMNDLAFYQPPSDASTEYMGWYIDDVIVSRSINRQPPQPGMLLSPDDGDTVRAEPREFSWSHAFDPDPRTMIEYIFHLEGDAGRFDSTGIVDTSFVFDVRSLDWVGLGEHLLHWSVDAVSQGDTVAMLDGPRSLVLPSLGVDEDSMLPRAFSLGTVYPNPFNATVIIPYELPRRSSVRLEVFNLLGQRVAVLEQGVLEAGRRRIVWQAQDHSTGLYFVRLQADSYIATQKMLLLK